MRWRLSIAFLFALLTVAVAVHGDLAVSINYILKSEGGYTNDPQDPGGPTNFGITIWDTRLYVKPDATAADVKALTKDTAITIYEKKYWDALNCDNLPAGLDYTIVDYGVNSGVARAGRVLREVLDLDETDWHITPQVLNALKGRATTAVIRQVNDERLNFLQHLRTWPRFGKGWGARVASVKAISLHMAGTPAPESGLHIAASNMFFRYVPLVAQPGPGKGAGNGEELMIEAPQ